MTGGQHDRQEATDQTQSLYRVFFENSPDAMYIGSTDGTIIDVNQAWLDLFGYSREQLATFNVADSYENPEDRAAFLEEMARSGYVHNQVRLKRRDSLVFDCDRTSLAVKDSDGNVIAFQGIMRDVTERSRAERVLRESEEKYRVLFENTMDAIALVSPGGLLLEANRAYLELFGCSEEDIGTLNVEEQYVDEERRTQFLEMMASNETILDDEVQLKKRDGSVMDCVRNVFVRRDQDGNVIGEQCVVRDVTEQKQAQEEIRASEERFRSLFEQSMDAIYVVDYDGSNMKANRAWMQLFGYTSADLATLNVIDLYANPADRESLLRRISRTSVVADEVRFKKKDGTVFDCARTVAARRDRRGNIVAFQGIMRDITEQKRAYIELERLARYDTLTGLLNRRAVLERLEEWMRHIERYKGKFCVIMLDLDHFKHVNDDYGHQVGDRVLAQTAEVLRQSLRQTDIVGRYGGEEFLVILPRTDCEGARVVAERIRTLMQVTEMSDGRGQTFTLTVSLGLGERFESDSVDSLVGRADEALYKAKENGRNRVEVLAQSTHDA